MARGWAAMQQQQYLLAGRLKELENELVRYRQGERDLRGELGAAQVSAASKRSQYILEERSMIHMAEERSAHHAMTITEAHAEERHRRWRSEAERVQQEETRKLKLRLEAALKSKVAMPQLPCPGCIGRDAMIAKLEEKNDVLRASSESEPPAITSWRRIWRNTTPIRFFGLS